MKLNSILLAGGFSLGVFDAAQVVAGQVDKMLGNWSRLSEGWVVQFYKRADKLCDKVISSEGVDDNTVKMSGRMMGSLCRSEVWPRAPVAASAAEAVPAEAAQDAAASAAQSTKDAANAAMEARPDKP